MTNQTRLKKESDYILLKYFFVLKMSLAHGVGALNILKAKSNFTLWNTKYIFTVFDLNQIKYCNELIVPTLT